MIDIISIVDGVCCWLVNVILSDELLYLCCTRHVNVSRPGHTARTHRFMVFVWLSYFRCRILCVEHHPLSKLYELLNLYLVIQVARQNYLIAFNFIDALMCIWSVYFLCLQFGTIIWISVHLNMFLCAITLQYFIFTLILTP